MEGRPSARLPLSQQFLHHPPMHVGEANVATAEAEGELFVIDAQQVEDGGVKIVDFERVFLQHGS